ncbi:LAMI_0C00254g1_1 [Lachancea mirantina]|uniref:LAMI_0C00254g1_1 n=1 Tax=Lachancea mirantina TaxID=1230905 RepID=A0A1G4IZT3_9SACH|nr:LAMI_0C00254g1_1 [Lachancea mirantina]
MSNLLQQTSNVSLSPYLSARLEENKTKQIVEAIDVDNGTVSDYDPEKYGTEVVRGLNPRHIQLIALGGAIGTGLFVGSGGALSTCGPAPLLISYIVMSFLVWTIMNQLTEMVTLIPLSGEASMYSMTSTYLNRPVSFMCGWNLFYAMAMIPPAEITACALLIKYWTDANSAIFISIIIVISIIITMLPVRVFGESEFWVASIKILTITGLIIVSIVIFFGGGPSQHHVLGFHYWKHPGAFQEHMAGGNTGKFLATWTAIVKSGFSFILIPELVTSCSAESTNPRVNMPKACRRYAYRLAFFYVLGSLAIGVVVSSDDKNLLNAIASGSSNAAASPFVIGIREAGIRVLPHIINACILTSAYSAGTAELYGASRVLHSMALKGDAPKIFSRVNKYGVPYYSTAVASLFCFLAYLNCSDSSSIVFTWLSNISTISGFISWVFVSVTYIRFKNIISYLGIQSRIPFSVRGSYICAFFVAGFFSLLSLTNGYYVFIKGNWNTSDFFACYVTIGFILALFVGSTIYYREWRFRDMDVVGKEIMPKIDQADQEEKEYIIYEPKNWVEKVCAFIC